MPCLAWGLILPGIKCPRIDAGNFLMFGWWFGSSSSPACPGDAASPGFPKRRLSVSPRALEDMSQGRSVLSPWYFFLIYTALGELCIGKCCSVRQLGLLRCEQFPVPGSFLSKEGLKSELSIELRLIKKAHGWLCHFEHRLHGWGVIPLLPTPSHLQAAPDPEIPLAFAGWHWKRSLRNTIPQMLWPNQHPSFAGHQSLAVLSHHIHHHHQTWGISLFLHLAFTQGN